MKNLFFVLLLVFIGSTLSGQSWRGIVGDGQKVKQTLAVDDFNKLTLSIAGDLYIRQGNSQSVEVEAQQNIIDNIKTEVKDDRWKVRFDKNVRKHSGVTIWVTVKDLSAIGVSGSGSITGENTFTADDLNVSISGSGNIEMDIEADDINVGISGSGNITLEGKSETMDCAISGSGNIRAQDFETVSCDINISGSGDVRCDVSGDLTATVSGSGDVYYEGNPRVKARVSGSGDIEPIGSNR